MGLAEVGIGGNRRFPILRRLRGVAVSVQRAAECEEHRRGRLLGGLDGRRRTLEIAEARLRLRGAELLAGLQKTSNVFTKLAHFIVALAFDLEAVRLLQTMEGFERVEA